MSAAHSSSSASLMHLDAVISHCDWSSEARHAVLRQWSLVVFLVCSYAGEREFAKKPSSISGCTGFEVRSERLWCSHDEGRDVLF